MIGARRGAAMLVPMDVTAQGFMIAESRRTPMHVGGLQLFEPPEGADNEWARNAFEQALKSDAASSLWLKRPYRSVATGGVWRSEEHTSELQSRQYLVCRLLL